MKSILYLFLIVLFPKLIFSQIAENNTINEAIIIKQQQEIYIDSLVKQELKKELFAAEGNVKKTAILEKKLLQIAINDSLKLIAQKQKIDALKKTAIAHPVVLNNDTILNIYTGVGSFSAEERAISVTNKILNVYKDPFYNSDSLTIVKRDISYDIVYKNDNIIISLREIDALFWDKPLDVLAQQCLGKIKNTVNIQRKQNSLKNIVIRVLEAILIVVILLVIIKYINRLFQKATVFIKTKNVNFVKNTFFSKVNFITTKHIENILLRINTFNKIATIIIVIYLSLPLLFSIFPATESYTSTLISWILNPLKGALFSIINYLPNLLKIIVIYFLFSYLIKGIKYFFIEIKRGNIEIRDFHPDWAIPSFNIIRFLLYIFLLIIIFPFLPGSNSPAFQGVSVFLGVLISLGSSSAISNMVAGLVITYMRPFKIGDRVKIGDVLGDVIEKSMLVTRIKTIKNEEITVPNSMVLSASVTNFSSQTEGANSGLIVHYNVTISYDTPYQQVYDLLIEAALNTTNVLAEPKPFVLQVSLDHYYISYQINCYTKEASKQSITYSSLLENIQTVFNRAGIQLLSPSYHVIKNDE